MAGMGVAPKAAEQRRRRNKPTRGEWMPAPGVGWQHQPLPEPPEGVGAATAKAWTTWMGAWFAAYWLPEDLPVLRRIALLYDLCEQFSDDPYIPKETAEGETVYVLRPHPASELRQLMDSFGITPKGQQDRRWVRPDKPATATPAKTPGRSSSFAHLRAVK